MTEVTQESQDKESSFEEIFTKLRESVEALESTELSLEDAMHLYEEGMKLATRCNKILNTAELRITKLDRDYSQDLMDNSEEEEVQN